MPALASLVGWPAVFSVPRDGVVAARKVNNTVEPGGCTNVAHREWLLNEVEHHVTQQKPLLQDGIWQFDVGFSLQHIGFAIVVEGGFRADGWFENGSTPRTKQQAHAVEQKLAASVGVDL